MRSAAVGMTALAVGVVGVTSALMDARSQDDLAAPTDLAAAGPGTELADVDVTTTVAALQHDGTPTDGARSSGTAIPLQGDGAADRTVVEDPFVDEILQSPMLSHPDFVREVRKWVRFWETAPARWFPDYLARMAAFEELVDTVLEARDLPWSLRYLPVIESGYSPSAVSSARAVGLWQFMAHTARDFEIEVTGTVDDRRDPFVSTAAAADYLLQLHDDFDSWFLALAAYNAGPNRIRGLIRRHAPDAELSDALYWALRPVLPRETADFVPNLFGAIIVASDPEAHGYELPVPVAFAFDRVQVRGRLSFETAAIASGTTPAEIARLNPEYVEGVTPSGRTVDLRIPVGRVAQFRAYFQAQADGLDG